MNDHVFGPGEIEHYVRTRIAEIAEANFPDNPGLQWAVHGFRHREDLDLIFAEVEPHPDEVGYPRFQFGFRRSATGPPKHVATYCLDAGTYTLMSHSLGFFSKLPKRLD
jgi:hypothetical protein